MAKKRQKKPLISQSLMKDLRDYEHKKLCGLQFEAKFIKGIRFPSSEAQRLGQYFEYVAAGSPNRHGEIPEPEKTQKGELTAKYKIAHEQAENFKRMMDHYKIEIISNGLTLTYKRYTGILDLVIKFTEDVRTQRYFYPAGTVAILDLKCSGLLEDKWNDYGWYTESIPNKDRIHLQATHYRWLFYKKLKRDLPFFFAVFSNTNGIDCKLVEMIPSPQDYWRELHEEKLKEYNKKLSQHMKEGFKAYPSVKECAKCPLKDTCAHSVNYPLIESVTYSTQFSDGI